MRADAAPWLPFTARNALVIATAILLGSKPTTAPLRRITLYSECAAGAAPVSGTFTLTAKSVGALS